MPSFKHLMLKSSLSLSFSPDQSKLKFHYKSFMDLSSSNYDCCASERTKVSTLRTKTLEKTGNSLGFIELDGT